MADVLANLPLGKPLPPGLYGAENGARVVLRAIALDVCTLVAGGNRALVIESAKKLDVELVDGPRLSGGESLAFVGTGPGRWLVLSPKNGLAARLEAALTEASVFEQGGGLVVLEASGPAVGAVLAKLVPLDLEKFADGDAATTTAAHINLTLWRRDGWRFAVGRSYLPAFLRAFAGAAAEYGLDWTGHA